MLPGLQGGSPRSPRLLALGIAAAACFWLLFRFGVELRPDAGPSRRVLAAGPAATLGGEPSKRSPYVAMCLSVKDEHADLPEWVEHHLGLGVGKIYVVDHGSAPPLSTVLTDHIASGAVEYTWLAGIPPGRSRFYGDAKRYAAADRIKGRTLFQPYVYDTCMELHRQKHTWMGFLDADEYVVLRPDFPDLPSFLRLYEAHGGLAINWIMMGSSGHITRPAGGVRASYTACTPDTFPINDFLKTFANLHYVLPTLGESQLPEAGPHEFAYRSRAYAVDSKWQRVDSPRTPHRVHDEIKIYHYILRSKEEWAQKVKRGNGMADPRPLGFFDEVDTNATAQCTDMLRYVGAAPPATGSPSSTAPGEETAQAV